MSHRKETNLTEKLDHAGRLIAQASGLSEAEVEKIAASPFLFSRVRAQIAGRRETSDAGSAWAGFWSISKKAIPAMALVAALSFGVSIYTEGNKTARATFSVDEYLGTNESDIESIVFAENRPLTSEEVLATIISREEREAGK